MSIKPIPCYTAVCDWPGCDADVMEANEYSGFGEVDHVKETMEDSDWHEGRDGTSHYCDKHPTIWASDYEDDEPFPPPPYLLIHDGDTGDRDDDGKVTLVKPVTQVLLDEGNVPLAFGGAS